MVLEAARLYAESQQDAIDHVERTAAELGIDCEWNAAPPTPTSRRTSGWTRYGPR
jgi:hypothetical protein